MNKPEKDLIKKKLNNSDAFNLWGIVSLEYIKSLIFLNLNITVEKEEIKEYILKEFKDQFYTGIKFN